MIVAALLLALQAPPMNKVDYGDWTHRVGSAMDTWKLCVLGTARSWARQDSPPSDIATGALGHCAALQTDMERALRSNSDLNSSDVDKLVSEARATWRERAVAAILEKRSAPATTVRKTRTK